MRGALVLLQGWSTLSTAWSRVWSGVPAGETIRLLLGVDETPLETVNSERGEGHSIAVWSSCILGRRGSPWTPSVESVVGCCTFWFCCRGASSYSSSSDRLISLSSACPSFWVVS